MKRQPTKNLTYSKRKIATSHNDHTKIAGKLKKKPTFRTLIVNFTIHTIKDTIVICVQIEPITASTTVNMFPNAYRSARSAPEFQNKTDITSINQFLSTIIGSSRTTTKEYECVFIVETTLPESEYA